MIETVASVIRGEGWRSAVTRAQERVEDGAKTAVRRVRGLIQRPPAAAILNVSVGGIAPRLGGIQTQLRTRLSAESRHRAVALLTPGILRTFGGAACEWPMPAFMATSELRSIPFEVAVLRAARLTGARAIHIEGTHGLPLESVLRLIDTGLQIIVSVHDVSLFHGAPHLMEEPHQSPGEGTGPQDDQRRIIAADLLTSARCVIFPSLYLRDEYRRLFGLPLAEAEVIEPGIVTGDPVRPQKQDRRAIAFAGSVQRHKGAALFADIVRRTDDVGLAWHVFGGGDEHLLRSLRALPGVTLHGYYRSGALPSLLAFHGIGLVVLPSVVPESFSLTLSESWSAGASVVAFDHGAIASRIRMHGGGWLAGAGSGAEGLAFLVSQWCASAQNAPVPQLVPSTLEAAAAHLGLYQRWIAV